MWCYELYLCSNKLVKVMKDAGFSEVAIMNRHQSRFQEMSNDKVKTWSSSFYNSYPLISC